MIIAILVLAVLDITLTHYAFFLDRKKDALDMSLEKNWLPRFIMRNDPNPINFIVGCLFNITVMGLIVFILNEVIMEGIIFGMLLLVNYSHYFLLKTTKEQWNNDKFWKALKLYRESKK